jgi:hypothetical protein
MRASSLQRQGKPLDAATVSASTKPAFQANSFDPFDVIKGHLLDEGYADTEESALAIMANMSEEWRESIVEGPALDNTIERLSAKADAMNKQRPGSANFSRRGEQPVGTALYKAYQRQRLEGV